MLLTLILLLPVAGALGTVLYSFAPNSREEHYKWIALLTTIAVFGLSLLLIQGTGVRTSGFRFEENVSWIGSIGARYHLGVDGISLWLVLLTTLLMPIAILSSWTAIKERTLAYYVFLLILEGAMIGVFVSLDLLLFYLFFEASLIPMFFLIGIWGGERRIYAAIKFFIYTSVGSLLMLVGIIALFFVYHSFDYQTILQGMSAGTRLSGLYQGASFPLAHLVARRPHRSAYGRLSDSCRRAVEDGHLWLTALQSGTFPRDVSQVCSGDDHPRRHRHHLWRAGGNGSARR